MVERFRNLIFRPHNSYSHIGHIDMAKGFCLEFFLNYFHIQTNACRYVGQWCRLEYESENVGVYEPHTKYCSPEYCVFGGKFDLY